MSPEPIERWDEQEGRERTLARKGRVHPRTLRFLKKIGLRITRNKNLSPSSKGSRDWTGDVEMLRTGKASLATSSETRPEEAARGGGRMKGLGGMEKKKNRAKHGRRGGKGRIARTFSTVLQKRAKFDVTQGTEGGLKRGKAILTYLPSARKMR